MDKFAELRAFVAVVDAGGFAAAARELGQSRSSINRLVLSLEERLAAQLLNRSTRVVSATSDGVAFYDRARSILDDLADAERAVGSANSEATGGMRISGPPAPEPLNISLAVRDFLQLHPRVSIDLTLEARLVDPVAEGYDLVVRLGEPDENSSLVDHRLTSFDYVVCASPDYLARHGEPKTPADLKARRLLNFAGDRNSRIWRFVVGKQVVEVPVEGPLCSNSIEPVREATLAGLGVAVLPKFAIRRDLETGALRTLVDDYALPKRVLQVIYPPSRRLSAKVRLFTDFLENRYADAGD